MRRVLSTLLLMSGLLGTGFAKAQSTPAPKGGLLVRILIFSGRKDPEFRITDPAQIARITAILNANTPEDSQADSTEVLTHKLGYRGMEIIPEPGVPGLVGVSGLAVNKDRIQVQRKVNGAARATHHRDVAVELENYLLELGLAQGHIDSKVAQRIHQQP